MAFPEILALASGILLISGYLPYVYGVIRRTTVPNRASWFIWALSTTVILFGVRETGTHDAIWVPIADAVGCTLIFLFAIFYGTGGWSRTDKISLAVALASLAVWLFTGNALLALAMNLVNYVSGYAPTIRKAWHEPRSESLAAWSLFLGGVVINLAAVAIGTDSGFAVWLYPIVLVATVGTLYAVLLRRCLVPAR